MEVVETSTDGLLRDFKVTIDAADIEARIESRLAEVGQGVRIPGFRPGKAPTNILKQRFGQAVRGEVLEAALRDSTKEVLSQRGLRPASQPQIEVTSYEDGTDLEYDLSVELLPDIEPIDFAGLELERLKVAATDSEVDDTLKRLAEQNRRSEPVATARAAKQGDIVVIDYVGKIDGAPFPGGQGSGVQLELGTGQFIPGFEDQLVGAKAGQTTDVTITFPDDYGNSELAGKEAVFACEVKEIREPVASEIDDELAKSMGLDSLDSLRAAIRDQLDSEYAQYARAQLKRNLLDKLSETHDFAVPPRMLEAEFEQIWRQVEEALEKGNLDPEDQDKSEEELRAQYREIAERRVRLGLLLSHVGESNELTVSQEEVNRAIMEQARQLPGQEQQVIDFYRNNAEAQASLQAPIFEDKVVDFILEMANVSERDVTAAELRAELAADAQGADDEQAGKSAAGKQAGASKKPRTRRRSAAEKEAGAAGNDDASEA